ncbi:hypothetical protein H4219_000601 [Mycoemilia scoparia]|uniref:Branchpoint-bridging protein n=1 Tax=Mycoemilia scoparia TaxID=417184 RepID=A0A9W8A2K1_9FUNG|nr:hypothetical protein H4219_000601 [Mycoemilia scoparia]
MHSGTGTNNIPLGPRNKLSSRDGEQESSSYEQSEKHSTEGKGVDTASALAKAQALANSVFSRAVADSPSSAASDGSGSPAGERRQRRRKNRWGDQTTAVPKPGLITSLPSGMDKQQMESYAVQVRIDEITAKIRSGNYVPPDRERSPSPEPVYNSEGKRINTREYRYRKKLEDERNKLIRKLIKTNPDYKPPPDYKKSTTISEKLYIPAKEYPDINFIGLLLGPRGNTLKKIQEGSGTKVSIRGKGSIKDGKQRDTSNVPGADDDLHCLIMAEEEENIKKAIKHIQEIIKKACASPEGHNELKRNQLRELAALNGTLRDDENQTCQICGAMGHMRWDCTEKESVTSKVVCRICGGHGHIARDCNQRFDPGAIEKAKENERQLNSDYLSLMAELGAGSNGQSGGGTPKLLTHGGPASGSGSPMVGNIGNADSPLPSATPPTPPWRRNRKRPKSQNPPPPPHPPQNNNHLTSNNYQSVPPPPIYSNNSIPSQNSYQAAELDHQPPPPPPPPPGDIPPPPPSPPPPPPPPN